jgi:uncharacterized protein (DUF697 family)
VTDVTPKKKNHRLPINPKALLEAAGLIEEQSASPLNLAVLVDTSIDPALVAYAKEALRPCASNLTLAVRPYPSASGYADKDGTPFLTYDTTLVVLFGAEATETGMFLNQIREEGIPVVVATLDPARVQQIARENNSEIDTSLLAVASAPNSRHAKEDATAEAPFERLFAALGDWIVRELPDTSFSLARALPFVRAPFVSNAIQATSLQNAVIAAVFFLPGADMPLLTLNQMKLFLKIAAVYDATLDMRRMRELAVLLAGGFGFRALARRLIGAVPVLGWAIRGGVGYTGTLAVGMAAREYFERGASPEELIRALRAPQELERAEPEEDPL